MLIKKIKIKAIFVKANAVKGFSFLMAKKPLLERT
jgi:hypothetical protein